MNLLRILKRSSAALVTVAFLYSVGVSAAGLRPCPHHDQVPAEHTQHHDMPDQTPEQHDGTCTCLGGAQCATPLGLPSSVAAVVGFDVSISSVSDLPLAHQAPAREPGSYLPPATAPPVLL